MSERKIIWKRRAKKEVAKELGVAGVGIVNTDTDKIFEIVCLDESNNIINRDFNDPLKPDVEPITVEGINRAKNNVRICCKSVPAMQNYMRVWELMT